MQSWIRMLINGRSADEQDSFYWCKVCNVSVSVLMTVLVGRALTNSFLNFFSLARSLKQHNTFKKFWNMVDHLGPKHATHHLVIATQGGQAGFGEVMAS